MASISSACVHHCNHNQALCNWCSHLNSPIFLSESAWQRQNWLSPWMISFPSFRMIWRKSWTQWSVTSAKGSTGKWPAVPGAVWCQPHYTSSRILTLQSLHSHGPLSNLGAGETTFKPDSFWGWWQHQDSYSLESLWRVEWNIFSWTGLNQ